MSGFLIKNVNILDGTEGMRLKPGYDILVKDGIIERIARNIHFGGRILDRSGDFVIPGLINMHVHLPGTGKVGGKKVADLTKLISFIKSNRLTREIGIAVTASGAKTELLSGVTTLRAVGGIGNCDSTLAKRVAGGKCSGPRILAANEAICTPGGHMQGTVSVAAPSVEAAVRLVEETKASGAVLIKLMITGGVLDCKYKGHPGELKMPEEMVRACCEKAHALGLKVAAHVEGPEGMEIAARCGVDTIEHGAPASAEALSLMKQNGAALICTLSPAVPLYLIDPKVTGYGEDCRYNTGVLFDGMRSTVKACLNNGIPVGLGTDTGCPFVTHYDMWRELYWFTKYIPGVDNSFAIHTATQVNAKILGMDDITGTIEEGRAADMLLTSGDPIGDIRALREPSAVIAAGRIYTGRNKKYPDIETALDGLMD